METTMLVFKFIRQYAATYPWSPSLREIADGCGFSCASSVVRHLDHLQAWGLIVREPGKARSIGLTEKGKLYQV
ncbi:MAG: hypothetical protein JXN59_01920 [Anaerolineae bacterium]|jgi:SOS-response transcriptional repressor LexA|nr:hypothetical protein [Anaerolineae bacterium]